MLNIHTDLLELGLTAPELSVLCHIAKRTNGIKVAFPSRDLLKKETKLGREALSKAIKGLIARKLISAEQEKPKAGKFGKTIYTLLTSLIKSYHGEINRDTETRTTETRKTGNRTTGNRSTENRLLSISNNKELVTISNINGKNELLPLVDAPTFSEFWELYKYKKNRKAAQKAWDKLKSTDKGKALKAVPQYLKYIKATNYSQCHASSWINGERWTDDNTTEKTAPKTKNLVDSYRQHLTYYLNEKQRKSLNGQIEGYLSKCKESGVQSEIDTFKGQMQGVKNKTFTDALIFDVIYGTLQKCGTIPERRFSKFRQWFNKLKDYDKNQKDLRIEFRKHLSK